MSIVVLFGAGASHGAGEVSPAPLPLGSGLYRELDSMFPATWGALPASLQARFQRDFEIGMGALWKSGSHAIPILMQQMAIFFARYRLSSQRTDAYSRLLENLAQSRKLKSVRFSSLNYDCLFEIAASLAGRTVNYFDDAPASDADVVIWKLHGSCNFLPEGGVTATRSVSFGSGVTFGTGLRAVNPDEVVAYCSGNTSLYPALAIYAKGKPVQIAPAIIERLQALWAAELESASKVVVIGVRPHPPDEHIWGPLSATRGELLFVGNKKAFSNWQSKFRAHGNSSWVGERFETCTETIVNSL